MLHFDRVFLHFLDAELQQISDLAARIGERRLLEDCDRACRWAYLVAETAIFMPVGFLLESPQARFILEAAKPVVDAGEFQISTDTVDWYQKIEEKRSQYVIDPSRHPDYHQPEAARRLHQLGFGVIPRSRSSTDDIGTAWVLLLDRADIWVPRGLPPGWERDFESIPSRLDGAAFVWDFVRRLLPKQLRVGRSAYHLARTITTYWLLSYLEEYGAAIVIDLTVDSLDCGLLTTHPKYCISLKKIRRVANYLGVRDALDVMSWAGLLTFRGDPSWSILRELLLIGHDNPLDAADYAKRAGIIPGRLSIDVSRPDSLARFIGEQFTRVNSGPLREAMMRKKYDWLNAISEGLITLVGPLGAPLKVLLELRKNELLAATVENKMSGVINRNDVADVLTAAEPLLESYVARAAEALLYCDNLGQNRPSRDQLENSLRAVIEGDRATLRNALARFFPEVNQIKLLLEDSAIELSRVNLNAASEEIWANVLRELEGRPLIHVFLLLYNVHRRKPDADVFRQLLLRPWI